MSAWRYQPVEGDRAPRAGNRPRAEDFLGFACAENRSDSRAGTAGPPRRASPPTGRSILLFQRPSDAGARAEAPAIDVVRSSK